jgi:hypothetical protein
LKAARLAKKFKKVLENSTPTEVVLKGNNKYFTSREAKTKRNSMYRGVSRNGNSWQVMLMGRNKKRYVGAIKNEMKAARIYDKLSI